MPTNENLLFLQTSFEDVFFIQPNTKEEKNHIIIHTDFYMKIEEMRKKIRTRIYIQENVQIEKKQFRVDFIKPFRLLRFHIIRKGKNGF